MSNKEKKKINSISMKTNYIGSISYINKNLDDFYEKINLYINSNIMTIDKLNRIIDLIKSTNAMLDDFGQKTKSFNKFNELLDKLSMKLTYPRIKNKIYILQRDIKYLQKIKHYVLSSNKLNYGSFLDQIINAYKNYFYYGKKTKQSVGQRMEIITDSFSRIAASKLNSLNTIKDLENLSPILKDNNINMYYSIVESWKYGKARIIWHRREDRFFINSQNDFLEGFVITRNMNEKIRQQSSYNLYISKNKQLKSLKDLKQLTLHAIDGIANQFYIKLSTLSKSYEDSKFGKETLYGVPIFVWVLFIEVIQYNGRKILNERVGFPVKCNQTVSSNEKVFYKVKDLLNEFPKEYEHFIPKMLKN